MTGIAGALLCVSSLVAKAQAQTAIAPSPASEQRQQSNVLGVIQSSENAAQWQGILARLQEVGIPYRVIDLQQVQQASDLAGVTVVFLPNVETITPTQLAALEEWAQQGGRLIVSGPVGDRSSAEVRRGLRSLLGAYWAFPLSQPAILLPLQVATQPWVREGEPGQVSGGVIIPAGPAQTVVLWRRAPDNLSSPGSIQYDGAAAMVITRQTAFLGWRWGDVTSGSVEFDASWLRATVNRQGEILPRQTASLASPPSPTPAPAAPPSSNQRLPFLGAPLPQRAASRSPLALPPRPSQPSSNAANSSQDPAERAAPAGLEVEMSAQPITTMEAIAMRQELENLIGRFESALLAASSANSGTDLRTSASSNQTSTPGTVLIASAQDPTQVDQVTAGMTNETVLQARQVLQDFPQQVAQQNYAAARQEWLQVRQMLWNNFPTDRPLAQPEIRAMWLDRGTIIQAGSRQGLSHIFDRLAAAGINTVFFETVNAGYPIYPSRIAPQQNPLVRRGWDPLADAVDLAHERGIELHAWVWTFAAGNSRHNALLNLPANYPGPVIALHPDWANYDNQGNITPPGQTKPFLDPANPAVRSYLLRLYQEIVTNYDVDGLQLDYIRYPFQDPGAGRTYGYGLAARQQFQQLTGVDPITITPDSPQLWEQWTEFRTQQINSFVAETSHLLRRINPNLVLSTAVFALSEHERVQKIQQNWEVWARRGDVDLIVTMSYAMDTNRLQRLAGPWLNADLGSVLVLPSIRLLDLSEPATVDQIQALRDLPAGGYSLFAVANLNDTLEGIFSRTQGTATAAQAHPQEPIPYRQPFLTAANRYAALQREWSFMLEHNQLWIRDPQLDEWSHQAEALGQALNQLAEEPSEQKFSRAKTLLDDFRAHFDRWMSLQSLNGSYRIQTWNHRLATLETLLNYGERFVLERQNAVAAQGVSENSSHNLP